MKTIDNDIKLGKLKNAYLLYGDERYLIMQYRDKLKNAIVPSDDTMNFARFEGSDINEKEVIDLAETLPFFADRRLILIEDSGFANGECEDLPDYLPEAPDTTFFLFVEKKVDKRSRLYKAIKKAGNAVEFVTPEPETLAKWIGGRVKKEGKNMSNAAYTLFIDKTGTDMGNIDRELEKLLCYTYDKDTIEVEDVEAITTEQIQNKVFEMVDSIANHNQRHALDLYYDLLAMKESPFGIIALINRHFKIMMNVKIMKGQGFGEKEIASTVGCPFWAVKKYFAQSRAFSIEQLKQAIKDGVDYEQASKSGTLLPQMAVELFIVQYSKKDPSV